MASAESHSQKSFVSSITHSQQSLASSLFKKEEKRLDRVYAKLARHVLALKERKITLLEQIDQAYSEKQRAIAEIDMQQRKQMMLAEQKRRERELQVIEQLKKRAIAEQRLKQAREEYLKSHKEANIELQEKKASQLLEIIRTNSQLQAELDTLLKRQAQLKQRESSLMKQIHSLLLQKQSISTQLFTCQQSQPKKKSFYTMKAAQLHQASLQMSKQAQVLCQQALSPTQFKDMTTDELLMRKSQEQLQKQLLYDSVFKLKNELSLLQRQNLAMSAALGVGKE